MTDSTDVHQLWLDIEHALSKAFQDAGWSVEKPRNETPRAWDMEVKRGPHRYLVELKVAREGRWELLQGRLATAILQGQSVGASRKAHVLAVVGARRISSALADRLREFGEQVKPRCAWGWIDGSGRLSLHGEGLEEVQPPSREIGTYSLARTPSVTLFSDLHQWMLKVLLANRIPAEYLGAPVEARRGAIETATQLAHIARVSVPTAARFVGRFEQEGFLKVRPKPLELVRLPELMEQWARSREASMYGRARWLLPPKDSLGELRKHLRLFAEKHAERAKSAVRTEGGAQIQWKPGPRAALALFSAAQELELPFVAGGGVRLYLERHLTSIPSDWGLEICPPTERGDVALDDITAPESTFRGAVLRNGVPVTDILQTWIDVRYHPLRGPEQAEQIWRAALGRLLGAGKMRG